MDVDKRPSRWRYLYPVALMVLGFLIGLLFIVVPLLRLSNSLIRVEVPGTSELKLTTGTYTIYLEYQSVIGNTVYSENPDSFNGLSVGIFNQSTNQEIQLITTKTSSNYSFGNRSGTSIWTFDIPSQGTYELTAKYPNNGGTKGILAIGQNAGNILTAAIGTPVVFLGTAIASVIWFFRIRRRRRKFKIS